MVLSGPLGLRRDLRSETCYEAVGMNANRTKATLRFETKNMTHQTDHRGEDLKNVIRRDLTAGGTRKRR